MTPLRALLALVLATAGVGVAVAPAHAGGTGSVGGRVTDQHGAPVTDAEVLWLPPCPDGDAYCGEYVPVGEAGDYRFGDLVPGEEYCLRVLADRALDEHHFCFTAAGGHLRHDVTLRLGPPPGTLTGTVTTPDGSPVADAQVWVDDSYDDRTDAAGRFVVDGIPVWEATGRRKVGVSVSRPGYQEVVLGTKVRGGTTVTLDVTLGPARGGQQPDVRPLRPRLTAARALAPRRAGVRFRPPVTGARPVAYQAQCVLRAGRGGFRGAASRRAAARTSPVVVRGLAPGRRYQCRVRARNEAGWGAYSAYSPRFRTPARRR